MVEPAARVNRTQRLRSLVVLTVLVLLATACSGELATEDSVATPTTAPAADPTSVPEPEPADEPTDDEPAETAVEEAAEPAAQDSTEAEEEMAAAPIYEDPRGGFFADFQTTFDRSHPFQTLDALCIEHPAAENRVATDPGITADSIEIGHMRQRLEDLEAFGFYVDVGDVHGMAEAIVDTINSECGGVRGRMLDMSLHEFSALDPSTQVTACLEATEDRNIVAGFNSSGLQGTGPLCMAEEHDTILLTTQSLSQDQMDRGAGNLVTLDRTQDDMLTVLANVAADSGLLEGATIGVVGLDTAGNPEATASLVDMLGQLGYEVAVNDTLGCEGFGACTAGLIDSVNNMLSADVDVMFPTINVTTYPVYLNEMLTQGFAPGDVQFFSSNFNSMSGDLTLSKILANGSEAAGELANGMITTDSGETGNYKLPGHTDTVPFNQLCIDAYAASSGIVHAYGDETDSNHTKQGMLSVLCSEIRMIARAIYDAGDNPTRADIKASLLALGSIDTNNMLVADLGPGKYALQNAFQTLTWTYPCAGPPAFDENDTCLVPNDDYFLIEDLVN